MEPIKTGYLRQDEDSHWYLVPEDKIDDFDNMLEDIQECMIYDVTTRMSAKTYDMINSFCILFDEYRISSPYRVKCIIEIDS